MIKYMFRMPAFPIIMEIDGTVIAARSRQGLEKKLSGMILLPSQKYGGVDSTGKAWDLYADSMILSPLTLRKRATKLQLIRLVNGRKNRKQTETLYSEKSLSVKTFERVFEELVNLVV